MPGKSNQSPRRPLDLLVVEDSEADYELLLLLFRDSDFAVTSERVEEGTGFREALSRKSWDLVISDHNLPRFGSDEAFALLREAGPDIPFIIVSGAIGEDVAVEAMLLGADDYVMKSNPKRLLPAVERSLEAAATRRERVRAQAAERESEQRLAALAAHVPGVVLQFDLDRAAGLIEVTWISEGAARFFGLPADELLRKPGLLVERVDPEDFPRFIDAAMDAAEQMLPMRWEGRIHQGEQGRMIWGLLTATPRLGANGRIAWDGVAIDITPQKDVENDLRESREALRALTSHLERVKEAERAEVARELHDEIGGLLTAMKVNCATIGRQIAGHAAVEEKLRDTGQLLEEVVASVKRLARSLRPAILDHGLAAAMEWQARDFEKRMNIPTRFTCNDENLQLDVTRSTGVFRVFQEALTNVAKHAGAHSVNVEVFANSEMVSVEIRDDGKGFAAASLDKPESFGIMGMRERLHRMGGWMDVSSKSGEGTTIMLSVPRAPPQGGEAGTWSG